jgi:hypothetical protein
MQQNFERGGGIKGLYLGKKKKRRGFDSWTPPWIHHQEPLLLCVEKKPKTMHQPMCMYILFTNRTNIMTIEFCVAVVGYIIEKLLINVLS